MIDYRFATRVNLGTTVGNSCSSRNGGAPVMGVQGRFSGPQLLGTEGRSVSSFTSGGVRSASLSAFSPNKIADGAGVSVRGNAINLPTTRIETSADSALSGARAWSPPD